MQASKLLCGLFFVMGCKSESNPITEPPRCDSAPVGSSRLVDSTVDKFATNRAQCTFQAGALAENTVEKIPNLSPLKHVFILMQENRSFDHYLSKLQPNKMDGLLPEDLAPKTTINPGEKAAQVPRYHETRHCIEAPAHEWGSAHVARGGGKLDGFVLASSPSGEISMGYYDETDLPFYYTLAQQFSISARYFSPLPGPTTPNRLYLYFGTSFGYTDAAEDHIALLGGFLDNLYTHKPPTISAAAQGDLHVYLEDAERLGKIIPRILNDGAGIGDLDSLWHDLDEDDLAGVIVLNSKLGVTDEHGPENPEQGHQFVLNFINKLAASKAWNSSIVFFTYDENGGYYDHVFPPQACPPDEYQSRWSTNYQDFKFDQYGFRVPFMAISPFAKHGYVSHIDADHTSILRFIEAWKHTGALTGRDANAWPLFDMFDFDNPPNAAPVSYDSSLVTLHSCPERPADNSGNVGCPDGGCLPEP